MNRPKVFNEGDHVIAFGVYGTVIEALDRVLIVLHDGGYREVYLSNGKQKHWHRDSVLKKVNK